MAAAPQHGKNGAFYAAKGIIRTRTLAFAISPSRITDSDSGFVTAGFIQDQKIEIVGSVANDTNGTPLTIASGGVAAGALTLTAPPTIGDAGPLILIYQNAPGGAPFGFTAWTLDVVMNPAESTSLTEAGVKTFIPGTTEWKGTAERLYCESDVLWGTTSIWAGNVTGTYQWVRFFKPYVAIPSAGTPSYFYEGLALVTASNITWPSGDIVTQKFDIQGVGVLTLVAKTSAW